jgi:hypothetical protein
MYKKNTMSRGKGNKHKLISAMTPELRETTKYKCKICGKKSKGHKAMMRHSWLHRAKAKAKSKELIVTPVSEKPTVRMLKNGHPLETQPVLNTEMTAVELLNKIYQQRDFINNMTKLIEGMLTTK